VHSKFSCVRASHDQCARAHAHNLERNMKKFVQKHFWKKHLCALQVFLCAHVSWPVCTRTCTQLRGNIETEHNI